MQSIEKFFKNGSSKRVQCVDDNKKDTNVSPNDHHEGDIIDILEGYDVRAKDGNIFLMDVVTKIIRSKVPKSYIKNIKNTITIDDKLYITPKNCIDILRRGKSKICAEVTGKYDKLKYVKDDSSIIDVEKKIFQFEGYRFICFFVPDEVFKWDVWLKGVEVAEVLGYQCKKDAVRDRVDKKNKMSYSKLIDFYGENLGPPLKNIDKQTIFINLSGFNELISESKKTMAKRLKWWVNNDVLRYLIAYGTYSMQPAKLELKFFYDDQAISQFEGKAVLYIAYIGKILCQYLFKFGFSRQVFVRDFEQHSKIFDIFKVIFIGECDNCEAVEKMFKNELKIRGLHRKYTINGKKQTELFTISVKFGHEFFIDLMKELIDDNKLPAVANAENKIDNLNNVITVYEDDKRIKEKELDYKMSNNFLVECQNNLAIVQANERMAEINLKIAETNERTAKINADKEITIKKLEFLTIREKNKGNGNKIINRDPVLEIANIGFGDKFLFGDDILSTPCIDNVSPKNNQDPSANKKKIYKVEEKKGFRKKDDVVKL